MFESIGEFVQDFSNPETYLYFYAKVTTHTHTHTRTARDSGA